MYKDFILTVDYGRPHKRSTSGRYRVCAKNEKQAKSLLQTAIGFEKVQILKEDDKRLLNPKDVRREVWAGEGTYLLTPVRHDNDPL